MDKDYVREIKRLREQPPNAYIDSQFNHCPDRILPYIKAVGASAETVLDFGCGHGLKALSIALKNPNLNVIGVDITQAFDRAMDFAIETIGLNGLPDNLRFCQIDPGESLKEFGPVDFIYSWSVFEHIEIELLQDIVSDMYASLSETGDMFCQIAPLYYSPYGSHLRDFLDEPWGHLLRTHANLRNLVQDAENPELSIDEINRRRWMFGQFEALNHLTAEHLEKILLTAGFVFNEKIINAVSLRPPVRLLDLFHKNALLENELLFVVSKSQPAIVGKIKAWIRNLRDG